VSRSDTQHQVSIHGHQYFKQKVKVEIIDQEKHVRPRKLASREAKPIIQTVLHQINTSGPSFQYQQFKRKINRPTSVAPCNALSWRSHITHLGMSWRVRRQIRVENNSHQESNHGQLPQPSPAQSLTLQCQQTTQRQRADHPRALIRDEQTKKQKQIFCNSSAVAEGTDSEQHKTKTHHGEEVADNRIAAASVVSPKLAVFFFFFLPFRFPHVARKKKKKLDRKRS
jgi:hypothetical protein